MTAALLNQKTKKYVEIFLKMCILTGIVLHIFPYLYNRSMWLDEAMLASSICTRSFSELLASPLDWGQSSAVGWLLIVKMITSIFGTSETALRIWSLVTSFGCIVLIYDMLKDKVEKNYALLITAIFSLTDRYIYYGNEVKPYMSDNFCCLLTLFLWQKYREKKVSLWQMVAAYSVIIWLSFPAVFFVAACMIVECIVFFISLIKDRNRAAFGSLGLCAVVLVSFIWNYILWLSKTSENAGGAGYWSLLKFPLIPASLSDIKLIKLMALQFWAFFPYAVAVVIISLFLIYVVICTWKKRDNSNLLLPFILSLFLLFAASYLGFYPIESRLVQGYAIIVLVMAGYSCHEVERLLDSIAETKGIDWVKIFCYGILAGCLAVSGKNGCKNFFASHVYKPGSEVSDSIQYLENNLTDSDVVYVFRYSIPVYTYETNYQISYRDLAALPENPDKPGASLSALPYRIDNTIYGQGFVNYFYEKPYSYEYESDEKAIKEDAQLIIENESVYLVTSHGECGIPELIEVLEQYGTVDTVVDSYGTHLYHFTKLMDS